ncbi:fatty acyl-CoA reductase wat-like [Chrysoperla carnea]|uniref:fatty acyl-CoA reductase wat-like n=1 Tax=Chrysoperla carnea TaxID=189513 RepID=UPI001D084CA5|nr:fatty acyl-CoA reductase wat-like [Chrysoperla carnea]
MQDYGLDHEDIVNETPIQKFFSGSTIFITGGTGFLGKILVEKLLRSCPNLKTIYLLVRPKKGKDMNTRLEEIFDDVVFKRLNKEQPKSRYKVVTINGDMSLPGLGISYEDRKLLTNEISVIFHCAATVRFDEKLKLAVAINVKGTNEIINLANECTSLKSIVHVSTAYSHCYLNEVDEKFYESDMHYQKLINFVDNKTDREVEMLAEDGLVFGKYPNTYTLTKAAAENLVRDRCEKLPMCVFRPSIVICTYKEPIRSWINNLYGPTGVVVGAGTGLLRTLQLDRSKRADIVPVDFVVNSMIASAYETAQKFDKNAPKREIKLYNYTATDNSITWNEFCELSRRYGENYPTIRAVWYFCLVKQKSSFFHVILTFLLHFIPALIGEIILKLCGSKISLLKVYKKINKFADVIAYFALKEWKFKNNNVQQLWKSLTPDDKKLFTFDMKELDWTKFMETHCLGLRMYLVKDDLSTLPQARKRWQRLYYLHRFVQIVFFVMVFRLLWAVFSTVSNKFF